MRVQDFKILFANQFELHDYDVVLNVLQVQVFVLERLACVDRVSAHRVLHLLHVLALDQKFVPVVGLLVDFVQLARVADVHELRDGALFEDLLASFNGLPVAELLTVSDWVLPVVFKTLCLHNFRRCLDIVLVFDAHHVRLPCRLLRGQGMDRVIDGLVSRVYVDFKLDLRIVVLCEGVAHITVEFGNRKVQFKLGVPVEVCVEQVAGKTANETPFVVLDDLIVVILQEL